MLARDHLSLARARSAQRHAVGARDDEDLAQEATASESERPLGRAAPTLASSSVEHLQRDAGNGAVARLIAAQAEQAGAGASFGRPLRVQRDDTARRRKKRKRGTAASNRKAKSSQPAVLLTPLPPDAGVTLSWGSKARQDVVAESSLEILRDVLRAAGLNKATITSTARSAADQARAMYQNLVGSGKGQGVAAQHRLYGAAGDAVVDTFVALREQGLGAKEIRAGMTAKIEELGPRNVSRHCADPSKLNVIDIGPNSLGGADAQKALVAAAQAEEGKRISKFIPYPKDPGMHFEIPPK